MKLNTLLFYVLVAVGFVLVAAESAPFDEYAVDPEEDFALDNYIDEAEEDDDEDEEDIEEEDQPEKVDVHIYVPVPAGATQKSDNKKADKTDFPKFPGVDKNLKPKDGTDTKDGDFISDHIAIFQNRVAGIVKRLKKEKEGLDREDKRLDAHLAAIKDKIAKAQRDIARLLKEIAKEQSDKIKAAREKELQDKMRSHPILGKLYTARKFVIELKRMVRALKSMNPDSVQYAKTMAKIQTKMAQAKKDSFGLQDLDDMLAVSNINEIEIDKVRDDEVAGLNGVLCALMKHIQGKINYWEAKLRADHENALAAAAAHRSARLADARRRLAEAQAQLAHYKQNLAEKHQEIKRKLRLINAQLKQLGAIDGHVTKYRRTRVAEAEADAAAAAKGGKSGKGGKKY